MKKFLVCASICLSVSSLSAMEKRPTLPLSQSMQEPRVTVAPFSQSRCPLSCICPACLENTNKLLEIVKQQYGSLHYIKSQLYIMASHNAATGDGKSKSFEYVKKQKELAEQMSKEILAITESARRFLDTSAIVSPRDRVIAIPEASTHVTSAPRVIASPRSAPSSPLSSSPKLYTDLAESTELSPNNSRKGLSYKKEKEKEKSFEEQEQETREQSVVLLKPDRTRVQYLPLKLNEMF